MYELDRPTTNERVFARWQLEGAFGGDVFEHWPDVPHVGCVRRRVVER